MLRGVPLIDKLRTERLIYWYLEEQKQEFHKTVLLVSAIRGSDNLQTAMQDYVDVMFPSEKSREELIEKYQDFLEEESHKEYTVRSLQREQE